MFHVHADTGSFTFDAFGASEAEARQALRDGWNEHARQTGAEWTAEQIDDDANVIEFEIGACYRDGTRIPYQG